MSRVDNDEITPGLPAQDDRWANHNPLLSVACPSCGSTRRRCTRPSGHDATHWHVAREDAYAGTCGCDGCHAWLASRPSR